MVAEQYPWPPVDGYRQRLHHLIAGLGAAGDVEVLALNRRPAGVERGSVAVPPGVRDVVAVDPGAWRGPRDWLGEWARGGPPRRLLELDWTAMATELVGRLRDTPPVDLIWYSHVDSWFPLHQVVRHSGVASPASIVDFDNLENLAMRLRRRTPPRFAPDAGLGGRGAALARWGVSRGFDLVDERRWDRLQRQCASQVDHVVVCSELDLQRSRCANAVVVGNGAVAPEQVHADRASLRGEAPTMFFVGALDYEPNTEAVEWFVREVLPAVRARVPDARLRVVGRGAEQVAWVDDVEGVDLVGPVEDLSVELDRADVSVVPIRVGAGTRLKVVEALANHLPLVTTTVGCEGIELSDGVHARIADDATSFATACAELLADGDQRQRLADAGAELFARRYDWAGIEERVADLARRTAAEQPSGA